MPALPRLKLVRVCLCACVRAHVLGVCVFTNRYILIFLLCNVFGLINRIQNFANPDQPVFTCVRVCVRYSSVM